MKKLELTFKSGATVVIDADSWEIERSLSTGNLIDMTIHHRPDATRRLHYAKYSAIDTVVEIDE